MGVTLKTIICWVLDPTNLTAISTLGIFAFTIVLAGVGICQARLIRSTIDLARDEFLSTHRPEIIVHNFEVAREATDDGEPIGAQFVVVNKGATAASILDIRAKIFMTANLRPGAHLPSIGYVGHQLRGGEIIKDVAVFGGVLDSAVSDINSGFGTKHSGPKLWCVGRITYKDDVGRQRETGFCRSYDAVRECWVKEPDSDYEYSY